jgi:hypothetical protein
LDEYPRCSGRKSVRNPVTSLAKSVVFAFFKGHLLDYGRKCSLQLFPDYGKCGSREFQVISPTGMPEESILFALIFNFCKRGNRLIL